MLGVERRQKIMENLQLEQKVYVSERSKGITDKTDPQIGVDFSSGLSTRTGGKRCTKVAVLNLSVISLCQTNRSDDVGAERIEE